MVKEKKEPRKLRTPSTSEGEENMLIALAYDRAKEKLLDGTASSQIIMHFLKAGSKRERLENKKLESENDLLLAKKKSLEDSADSKEMYEEAIRAFRGYSGQDVDDAYPEN